MCVACFGNLARHINNSIVDGRNRHQITQILLQSLDDFFIPVDQDIPDLCQNGWVKIADAAEFIFRKKFVQAFPEHEHSKRTFFPK